MSVPARLSPSSPRPSLARGVGGCRLCSKTLRSVACCRRRVRFVSLGSAQSLRLEPAVAEAHSDRTGGNAQESLADTRVEPRSGERSVRHLFRAWPTSASTASAWRQRTGIEPAETAETAADAAEQTGSGDAISANRSGPGGTEDGACHSACRSDSPRDWFAVALGRA